MKFNRKSLGTSLLSLEKGENEEVKDMKLKSFALVENKSDETVMICFTTEEAPEKYFWASTSLYNFLTDNVDLAEYDEDSDSYSFPDGDVTITHCGKTPLKSDKNKSANVWKIVC